MLVCTVHMELCLLFSTIRCLLKGFHMREATVNKNEKAVVCNRGNVLFESWNISSKVLLVVTALSYSMESSQRAIFV